MGVTVAVTRVAANTVTGDQTITTNDLGGLTPKAVLLIATRGVTDGTAVDGAGWYMGASDGTNEWTESYESQHAQATMDSEWVSNVTGRILSIYDGTADNVVDGIADFVSFDTDGCTINWSNAVGSAYLITAIFFAGSDLTAHVGTSDLGNTADALVDITSVGFEADVLLTSIIHGATTQGPGWNMGFVHNNRGGTVTQRSATHSQRNAFGTSQTGVQFRDGECIAKLILSSQALDWAGAATSFDSSGFSIQLSGGRSPNNTDIGWIALRFGTSPVVSSKVYTYTTPTATGSHTDSTPGFTPQAVFYIPNRAAAADTSETDADGGVIGFLAVDADDLYTNSIADADALADSDTQSLSDNILNLPTHTGGTGHQATLTSLGSTGPVWNYSATDTGTARLWPALAIEYVVSGTQYPQTVSGGITPTGALFKDGRKVLSGANTPSGALTKETSKTFAGGFTPAGGLTKQINKLLEGAISSIVGTLTTARIIAANLSGALTPSGDISKQTNKTATGTLTSSGEASKLIAKLLSGDISVITGSLTKQTNKILSGAITSIVGTLQATKTALVSLGGTLTSAGSLLKQANKNLIGDITPSGSLSNMALKFLGSILNPTGAISKQTSKTASGEATPAGSVTKQTNKSFSGTLTSAGSLLKQTLKFLAGVLTSAGDLIADFIPGGGNTFFKDLAGTLTSDGAIQKITSKLLGGSLSSDGQTSKSTNKNISGDITPTGSITKAISKFFSGVLNPTGLLETARAFLVDLSGTLTSFGAIIKQTNKSVSGSLSGSGTISKLIEKMVSGNLTSAGQIIKGIFKSLSGVLSGSGFLSRIFNLPPASVPKIYLRGSVDYTIELDGLANTIVEMEGSRNLYENIQGKI